MNSGYIKDLIPSIDRIKNNKPYTFSNICLTTWQKNNQKQYDSKAVKVFQYSLSGILIKSYKSLNKAGKKLGINRGHIYNCCIGIQKTAKKYIWKFE